MIDEILQKLGLKYEDLSPVERETLNTWINALQQGQISTENIRQYIQQMRDGVENELTKMGNNSKQDIFLKARLRNYMLLEAFLTTPEKAKAQLDRALAGIVSSRQENGSI